MTWAMERATKRGHDQSGLGNPFGHKIGYAFTKCGLATVSLRAECSGNEFTPFSDCYAHYSARSFQRRYLARR